MPTSPEPDPGLHGYGALYRLYEANDGWIFLASPKAHEWDNLTRALGERGSALGGQGFRTVDSRAANDEALTDALTSIFALGSKHDWERDLTAADVGCVGLPDVPPEVLLQLDEAFEAGYSVEAESPIFETHRRLSNVTRFSRSETKADGGCMLGEQTDAILSELGYDDEAIVALRDRGVIA